MGSSTARWFVENHIVYIQNMGQLTTDDFRNVDGPIRALMSGASGDHKVHLIVDCSAMEGSLTLDEVERARRLTQLWDARTGWVIVVDPKSNFILKVVSGLLANGTNAQITTVTSLNEAVPFLIKTDPMLKAISVPDIEQWVKKQTAENVAA